MNVRTPRWITLKIQLEMMQMADKIFSITMSRDRKTAKTPPIRLTAIRKPKHAKKHASKTTKVQRKNSSIGNRPT